MSLFVLCCLASGCFSFSWLCPLIELLPQVTLLYWWVEWQRTVVWRMKRVNMKRVKKKRANMQWWWPQYQCPGRLCQMFPESSTKRLTSKLLTSADDHMIVPWLMLWSSLLRKWPVLNMLTWDLFLLANPNPWRWTPRHSVLMSQSYLMPLLLSMTMATEVSSDSTM